jgi:hypothetical protein
MKYKITFTIQSEDLFQILSSILPLSDLAVEEAEPPPQQKSQFVIQHPTQRPHRRPAKRTSSVPFNPNGGINKIILSCLATGPHRALDIRPLLAEGGYSPNSIGSRLQKLHARGVITQMGDGLWSLASQDSTNPHL